jgi:hypothetical protein
MSYQHMTFEEFERRVKDGHYPSRKAMMLSVRSAAWKEPDRARALRLVERAFPQDHTHALGVLKALLVKSPELAPHVAAIEECLRKKARGVQSDRHKVPTPRVAGPSKLRLAPSDDSDVLKGGDIAKMFDLPDDDDEPDPEEGPVTREEAPVVAQGGFDPAEVARVCAPRSDLENAIAEGDADDRLDEKQKVALRVATQKLIEMRDAEAKKAGK